MEVKGLKRDFGLGFKIVLLLLFASIVALGASEYSIILERFVKLICTSCIGL
jgi:hypothetical protein